ncbi:MAG: acyltransferase [Pseudomonadota bacterium]
MLGIPEVVERHPGIDRIGSNCRIAPNVSVMRYGADEPVIMLGDDCSLYDGVRLVIGDPSQHPDCGLRLGQRVIVNVGAYLSGEGGLTLEDDVLIGPGAYLLSAGHRVHGGDPRINHNPLTHASVHVGVGAWVGAGAVVLQGVSVGRGAVVGAGSVVTRDVPDFAVAVGNPARVVHIRQGFGEAPSQSLLGRILARWRWR